MQIVILFFIHAANVTTLSVLDIIMTTLLSPLLSGLALDRDEYIDLLTKLIGESVHVQNNPRQGLVSDW